MKSAQNLLSRKVQGQGLPPTFLVTFDVGLQGLTLAVVKKRDGRYKATFLIASPAARAQLTTPLAAPRILMNTPPTLQ